eukprot:409026-Pelagomonas_calceolata.AAC.1
MRNGESASRTSNLPVELRFRQLALRDPLQIKHTSSEPEGQKRLCQPRKAACMHEGSLSSKVWLPCCFRLQGQLSGNTEACNQTWPEGY